MLENILKHLNKKLGKEQIQYKPVPLKAGAGPRQPTPINGSLII